MIEKKNRKDIDLTDLHGNQFIFICILVICVLYCIAFKVYNMNIKHKNYGLKDNSVGCI